MNVDGKGDGSKGEEGKILIGQVAGVEKLYQKLDEHEKISWSDKYPEDLEEAAENDRTLKYAIIARYCKFPRRLIAELSALPRETLLSFPGRQGLWRLPKGSQIG